MGSQMEPQEAGLRREIAAARSLRFGTAAPTTATSERAAQRRTAFVGRSKRSELQTTRCRDSGGRSDRAGACLDSFSLERLRPDSYGPSETT
jgi:hypothetical protein